MTGRKLLRRYLKDEKKRSADLVRELPVDDGLFSRWLSGTRTPSLRYALRIEQVTGGKVPAATWVK